jgi:hypothetical protein
MWDLLPAIKERYQRFQISYHVEVLAHWEHCILAGFHIEEAIYGPRYLEFPRFRGHPNMLSPAAVCRVKACRRGCRHTTLPEKMR